MEVVITGILWNLYEMPSGFSKFVSKSFTKSIAQLPRRAKILIMVASDAVLLPMALWSAIALRYGTLEPEILSYWWLFFLVPVFTVPILLRLGLYRAVIRYLDEKIIKTVFLGVTLSIFVLMLIVFMTRVQGLPRTSIIMYWVLAITYIGFSRYLARGLIRQLQQKNRLRIPVAIYGAGQAGMQTALALRSGLEYLPVLFFDDSRDLQGTNVAGLRVYDPKDAIEVMSQNECVDLLLAIPSAPRSKKFSIIQKFEGNGIRLKTIPGIGELVSGSVKVDDIREVGIEDLLGRDPVPPFKHLVGRSITEKVVMVTGAGGSIGSELCRQILVLKPKKLILFERSEFQLYQIEMELRKLWTELSATLKNGEFEIIPILGDVLRLEPLALCMQKHAVQTVYHAAAYKHVPLVESNEVAGVANNVIGTLTCAKAAIRSKVESFVLISTDKAVRPTNVMGATKRFAELCLQMLAKDPDYAFSSDESGHAPGTSSEKKVNTKIAMVRFGNVLGSSGSVVPLFREQIKNGGPVTVTHAEMTRFFMTIPEAALLVIQAGAMASLSDSGQVYLLDMGEPVKIMDLAKRMVELSGFSIRNPETGEGDIAIEVVGLRPAEKLYEELLIDPNAEKTEHPRIMKASEASPTVNEIQSALREAEELIQKNDALGLRELLKRVVVEYNPKS